MKRRTFIASFLAALAGVAARMGMRSPDPLPEPFAIGAFHTAYPYRGKHPREVRWLLIADRHESEVNGRKIKLPLMS